MEELVFSPKTNLSIRICPVKKQKLIEEANKVGITLSELAEGILMNSENLSTTDKCTLLQKENDEIKLQVQTLKSQTLIFNNPTLLHHFSQVRGMEDEITGPNGRKLKIKYDHPVHLLYAMIYSFKVKS